MTLEIQKHMNAALDVGEAFELDLPSDKKDLLESADSILTQHFVASKEFMLLLTLQRPTSSKFSERLVDYTAEVSSHCGQPWQKVITPALVKELEEAMTDVHDKKDPKEKKNQSKRDIASEAGDTDKKAKKDKKDKKDKKLKKS